MLFRRKGTASTILAIALLIALITSVTSLVNNINFQTTALSKLAGVGTTYLVINENSSSLMNSEVNANLATLLQNDSDLKNVIPQTMLHATLTASSGGYTVVVRGVDNPKTFLKAMNARINGTFAVNETQANVGEILAKLCSISVGDEVTLTDGNRVLKVKVVGIVRTTTQSDSEIIVPMITANALSDRNGTVSVIEFTSKNATAGNTLTDSLSDLLPSNVKIVKVQQLDTFAVDVNNQILSFLNLWSIVIYAVVVAASYVVASRLIAEANYELAMIKTLGAKRRVTFQLVLTHTVAVALFGSILGLAIGIAGAQVVSTGIRWVWSNMQVTPFLEVTQMLQILALSLASSVLGCIYPALKSMRKDSVESSL